MARVLLVEPYRELLQTLQALLDSHGYSDVVTARSGLEVLDFLGLRETPGTEDDIDVILMDAVLPDLDVVEVCRRIKADPRWHDVPVLLLTDTLEETAFDLVQTANACDYLTKPLQLPAFLGRLRMACRLKEELDRSKAREQELLQATSQLKRLNGELQRLTVLDDLTGVANRRFFNTLLAQEWGRAVREVLPLSLILIDIDFFKNYNDYYGHQKGDECLCRVAAALNSSAKRSGDYVARYGGEEFVIILPHTGVQGAAAVAEGLRRRVETLGVEHARSPIHNHVTISLGVASTVPERHGAAESLVAAADHAVYQAKQDGRNRVRLFQGSFGEAHAPHRGPHALLAQAHE